MPSGRKKVAVALSGGVDSAIAAARLLDAGYEVFALWMQLVGDEEGEGWRHAEKIAGYLGIPIYCVDLRGEFEGSVVSYFLSSYLAGRTPNPCCVCNQQIKFGALLARALALGGEYLATGHYARCWWDEGEKRYALARGLDREKDQSYFLWGLRQEGLAHALFPNGDATKDEVKAEASARGIPFMQGESQDCCFLAGGDYRGFLEARLGRGEYAGDIVDTDGRVIGRHKGVFGFTIGQRGGIGVPARRPYYVVGLAPERRQVIVGTKEELLARGLVADGVNWVSIPPPKGSLRALGQIRGRHHPSPCEVKVHDEEILVIFDEPQEAITPGQAIVIYERDRLLGGGWIKGVTHE